jgi:hypothetical protein
MIKGIGFEWPKRFEGCCDPHFWVLGDGHYWWLRSLLSWVLPLLFNRNLQDRQRDETRDEHILPRNVVTAAAISLMELYLDLQYASFYGLGALYMHPFKILSLVTYMRATVLECFLFLYDLNAPFFTNSVGSHISIQGVIPHDSIVVPQICAGIKPNIGRYWICFTHDVFTL